PWATRVQAAALPPQLHPLASLRRRHLPAQGPLAARRWSYHQSKSCPNWSWISVKMMIACWTTPTSTAQSRRTCRLARTLSRGWRRILGQQLHEVALRAASCLGVPLPPPPSVRSSLLDGEFYAGPAT